MAVMLELESDPVETRTYAGQCIYEHRIAAGQTVQSVATALGLSQPYITQIETGRRTAPPETLKKIADVLGIAPGVMYIAYLRDLECAATRAWMGPQP
jgi:transcriptional regulator with XRE-family HTH domain